MRNALLFIIILLALSGCTNKDEGSLMRAKVDGLNKEAFVNRYRDPFLSISKSREAAALVRDSMPEYQSGLLRAWNTMAFAYLMRSDEDSVEMCLDSVFSFEGRSRNLPIELTIARLTQARLLQRRCRIAESFEILNDIAGSHVLENNRNNLLYNYAQTEYYITVLTLNYHYRDGKNADVRLLLDEVERRRPSLPCDFAQDMALNYALAYGYTTIGTDSTDLQRAMDYCADNLDLVYGNAGAYSLFDEANTLQIMAHAMRRAGGDTAEIAGLYGYSTDLFWQYADPYQMLGATVASARFALSCGDTAMVHTILTRWLSDSLQADNIAPKFEARLYDLLLRSGYEATDEMREEWYDRELRLQQLIDDSREDDFQAQRELDIAERKSATYVRFAIVLLVLLIVLIVLVVLLLRQTQRLHREKNHLEKAKRRDVARIANVETCLSVMRHDIGPFISYLQNENLPTELRGEVLQQLLRTFDNIKNWTNLSIPTGLTFNASPFPLEKVFAQVAADAPKTSASVTLSYEPTRLSVDGDRQLVTIMLRNLVSNALRHTSEGTVTVSAELYADDPRFVRVCVADTGSGMDEETLENLFRADKPTPRGEHGSGFGLILCRYIIKKHDDNTIRGCKIWAESRVGEGSQFYFLLKNHSDKKDE